MRVISSAPWSARPFLPCCHRGEFQINAQAPSLVMLSRQWAAPGSRADLKHSPLTLRLTGSPEGNSEQRGVRVLFLVTGSKSRFS